MSTIWEMAAIIRAEEQHGIDNAPRRIHRGNFGVDIDAPGRIEYWCRYFGTTPMHLCCAIDKVGREPAALRRYLSSRRRDSMSPAAAK